MKIKKIKKRSRSKFARKDTSCINEEYQDGNGDFKKGNPGKPKGALGAKRRFIVSVLSVWRPEHEEKLKEILSSSPPERFLRALDRLIAVSQAKVTEQEMPEDLPALQILIDGKPDST